MPTPTLLVLVLLVAVGGLLEILRPGAALICAHVCIGAAPAGLVPRHGRPAGHTIYAAGSERALDQNKSFWMRLGGHHNLE